MHRLELNKNNKNLFYKKYNDRIHVSSPVKMNNIKIFHNDHIFIIIFACTTSALALLWAIKGFLRAEKTIKKCDIKEN